ncbi:Alpha-carbonic anhydrase [Dermatophagoides farinae]|uniref:Carbonic anhydrase n=1 Tax=Dermatophagoides farinae TaxID=6954 RepID=A0A922L1B9_DERFA|nr:carbonic anhydrase-like isoform X1 [Dermatophagoides farinae]KAH7637032.1 carbonic anhydrase-like protein [Dermatophagoides farinae]KAH9510787.1 Alpha-carbonic anhydrase [Dermatophagoides farinae]
MAKLFAIIILLSCYYISTAIASDWSYSDQQSWANGENQCDGSSQSPIDINTQEVYYNGTLKLDFINYDHPLISYKVTNNGHSIQFDYTGDVGSAPAITGTVLNNEIFRLAQFHFHWGSAKHIGSEHKINGRAFPVELHLVHYNHAKHDTLSKALEARDGSVSVLAVFFEIKKMNPGFEVVADMIDKLQEATPEQSQFMRETITLQNLLPKNSEKLYRYHGSLTTPPCTEGLVWLILNQPNEIGRSQFEKFLGVIDSHSGEKIANNFRKIQPLNGRKVESSFKPDMVNKGFVHMATSSTIIVSLLMIFLSIVGISPLLSIQ